mgnify:FL=1
MAEINGFLASSEFYDDKHFPRGFKRSGDFTIPEAEILSTYGLRLLQLESKKVTPETETEDKFVFMCQHNLRPETEIERVWAKYKNLITSGKPLFTLHARAEDVEDDPSLTDDEL